MTRATDVATAWARGWKYIAQCLRNKKHCLYVAPFIDGSVTALVVLPGLKYVTSGGIHTRAHLDDITRRLQNSVDADKSWVMTFGPVGSEETDMEFVMSQKDSREFLGWLKAQGEAPHCADFMRTAEAARRRIYTGCD